MRPCVDLSPFRKSQLVAGAGSLWDEATRAGFLSRIADGSLPEEAFRQWLVQDSLFTRGLVTYQAIMVSGSPRSSHRLLISGLSALDDELLWFEESAAKRGLRLEAESHPVCRRYVDFLIASAYTLPFAVLAAILYGVEVSYLAAWSALDAEGVYAEFIGRWSNDRFAAYVRGLLDLTGEHPHPDAQEYFDEVLLHERDFWQMTVGA